MKRIGHLFERVVEPDNLRIAFVKASRGKRHRADQLAEAAKPEELTEAVLRSIEGFGEARMKKYAEALLKV